MLQHAASIDQANVPTLDWPNDEVSLLEEDSRHRRFLTLDVFSMWVFSMSMARLRAAIIVGIHPSKVLL